MKELGSPVADLSLLPRSWRKHIESGPTAPQVSTVMLGPDGHTSWLSQSLDALPHTLPWQLLDSGSHKRCPCSWRPTPRTSDLTREPWSLHQGVFHQLGMFADANE